MSGPALTERAARLRLSLICEPGDPRLPALLAELQPADLVERIQAGRMVGGRRLPSNWVAAAQNIESEVEHARQLADVAGLRWIVPSDGAWPDPLNDLDHALTSGGATGAPLGLWVRGKGSLAGLVENSVSIVGARDCTAYGAEQAAEIAADAGSAGFTVVSGAAFGIDACAHRGALAVLTPTIAVLACDAATSYPRAHAALLERIAEEGLVVSEQPPGRAPTKARFLTRNRLIAALTAGTVVVEARRRSGALNTLAWADQLGRATMAMPGPVTSQLSVGTHEAIRDGKAMLVTTGPEVIAALGGLAISSPAPAESRGADTAFDALTTEQARVLDALEWSTPFSVSTVAGRAKLGQTATERALHVLHDGGWAARDDLGRWRLVRRADLEQPSGARTVGE
ncbi:MAG TPA: DNA-processing protein DprA [Aeromicrobium sp.]|nr:DNA-processing protein DprA [Aeromicrobium sp.]